MKSLPQRINVDSDTYGPYISRFVGVCDIPLAYKRGYSVEEVLAWDDKWHPASYFVSHTHQELNNEAQWAVWVPMESDNPNLPISICLKEVEKWLEASEFLLNREDFEISPP